MGLIVAVTGPTGEIGIPAVDALEREPEVERIIGMARRPFDPASYGWVKTEYRRGDILDRDAVEELVAEADVVVHLAYVIMGSRSDSRLVNLDGTRNVFEATAAAERPTRLVYTSSVAAYGYHPDNPQPLTEDVPTRGSKEHYYSQQKAECEGLLEETTAGRGLEVYVLRPCIVAGPQATALADSMPWRQVAERLPSVVRTALARVPGMRMVVPDPGNELQLVHHDDVAQAIAAAAVGRGEPGAYNLAADGTVSFGDVVAALGARTVPVPRQAAVLASGVVAKLPWVPSLAEWIHVARVPVLMDTTRAKERLGWRPQHSSAETLTEMATALKRRAGS
ncbi:MAG: NAD-dependent epimerase/dehydratase family protein [Actinomycetota bacterium]